MQSRDNKNVSNYPEDHASPDGEKIDSTDGCSTPTQSEQSADQCATSREGCRGEGQATEELNSKSVKGSEEQSQHENLSVREAADKTNGLAENETPARCLKPLTGSKYCSDLLYIKTKLKLPQLRSQLLWRVGMQGGHCHWGSEEKMPQMSHLTWFQHGYSVQNNWAGVRWQRKRWYKQVQLCCGPYVCLSVKTYFCLLFSWIGSFLYLLPYLESSWSLSPFCVFE